MILIVSNTQDVTADFVVREIQRRDLPFARLNTDEFPKNAEGTASFGFEDSFAEIRWKHRERPLIWAEVSAVWYRRPKSPVVDESIVDPGIKKFAVDEAYEFLRGNWYGLDCFWVSHPDAIRRAEHKMVQLELARRCGFHIPKTVVTNVPEEVRKLMAHCPCGVVAKALYMGFMSTDAGPRFIYTTRIEKEHLEELESVRMTPAIFQEQIGKTADLRVTVVGERIFSTKITAVGLPEGVPDWRAAPKDRLEHQQYELPPVEAGRCRRLVRELGLEFGAIDLAVTSEGEHVFFEINPNGQWAWLESMTGDPISEAIVDHLQQGSENC